MKKIILNKEQKNTNKRVYKRIKIIEILKVRDIKNCVFS